MSMEWDCLTENMKTANYLLSANNQGKPWGAGMHLSL